MVSSDRLDAVLRAGVAVGAPKRQLLELDPEVLEAMNRNAIAAEKKRRGDPPPPPPSARVTGTMIWIEDDNQYAVVDADKKRWWYPNVAIVKPLVFRSDDMEYTKLYIRASTPPPATPGYIEVTSKSTLENHADNIVVAPQDDGVYFKFPLGARVSFVPYKHSDLILQEQDHWQKTNLYISMHKVSREGEEDYTQPIPKYFDGVATQVRMARDGDTMERHSDLALDDGDPIPVWRGGIGDGDESPHYMDLTPEGEEREARRVRDAARMRDAFSRADDEPQVFHSLPAGPDDGPPVR